MQENQSTDPAVIREFIVETFLFGDGEGLSDDASFMETGIIDSMGILKVADFIDRTYGIRLQPDQFIPDNLDSVEKIAGFVSRTMASESIGAATAE